MGERLSVKLKKWRCDRPDEWKMDEFIRLSQEMEDKLQHVYNKLKEAAYSKNKDRQRAACENLAIYLGVDHE